MQTATSETEIKSLYLSICVHHYTLRAPCPKGQGTLLQLLECRIFSENGCRKPAGVPQRPPTSTLWRHLDSGLGFSPSPSSPPSPPSPFSRSPSLCQPPPSSSHTWFIAHLGAWDRKEGTCRDTLPLT